MNELKTSRDYGLRVEQLTTESSFKALDELNGSIACTFAYQIVELGELEAMEAFTMKELRKSKDERGKNPSVAACVLQYNATDYGQKQIKLKRECEALRTLAKVVESRLFNIRAESRLTN